MSKQIISATIDDKLAMKLKELCSQTERKRSWIIEKAIEAYLDEIEDLQIADERRHDKRLSSTAFKRAVGV